MVFYFFFSSRRRHTRWPRDWSSDVCSSDLEELQKRKAKGIQKKSIRMLIAGIPNVGKSTLINRLANKRIAKIGDRPGVTRQPLWIKVGKQLELLDTRGVLWPTFEDQIIGMKLAAIGSIKYELHPAQDVAAFVIKYIGNHYL